MISAKRFHIGQRITLNFIDASDNFQWEFTTLASFCVSETLITAVPGCIWQF